jgi:membrane protease subunit HflC
MRATGVSLLIVIVLAAVLASGATFVVTEGQQVVVTEFGRPIRVVTEAGLNFKVPFAHQVHQLEKRLLPWDGAPENMQTRDKKRIFIDVWARWRIIDPMRFFQAVRNEQRGQKILDDLVDSAVRDVVARYNLIEVVRSTNRELLYESEELAQEAAETREQITTGRAKMEAEILVAVSVNLKEDYGMELTDVHVKRINYIDTVRQAVYDRMISERMRIARLYESEAEEEKNRILGKTHKELDEIEGEMEQRAAEIRGQADAEVIRIAAEAFSQSPKFYAFLRRLEAYKNTLTSGTELVLSTDNEFFRQFQQPIAVGQQEE